MKNKLGLNFLTSEKFVGDLPVNVEQQRTPKNNARRESVTPKIVVCPPIEEMTETISAPRGGRLLKALSSRLSRRATDSDSMGSSSSNESVSGGENGRADDRSSCSVSESGSDGSDRQRRHRSTVSLRRVFQSLTLSGSRSQSCSPTERTRPPKKQQQPKRILRPPVTYTYVRGLSGLPTQRVPRHTVCCASSGLNR